VSGDGFAWGAATSAYQIEGAVGEDGRGESIWDRFCATPGKVRNGESGEIACDFYHRYPQDIELMRELGLNAFRFSTAWPRIVPDGRGRVNDAGLDFYDRLVDALLAAGVEPFLTLFHWDLPQALEERGGWVERGTVEAFGEYVAVVAARLGDRVRRWITHNEPWVAAWLGYGYGVHAPGRTGEANALAAAHHLLLSHGRAVEILRAAVPGAQVGITLDLYHVEPATQSEQDLDAARHADGMRNRWFLDPVFRGAYPADMLEEHAANAPRIEAGDLDAIAAPIDFFGMNYYSRNLISANPADGRPVAIRDPESRYTDIGWEIYPHGLSALLHRVQDEYGPAAIYITENGAAFTDVRGHDGSVDDPERVEYIALHTGEVLRARDEGVPVAGYFLWSLLDNFEWAQGYQPRFGIVYVDYPTLERVPKTSFAWYRDLIARERGAAAARPELRPA
jgi:beta-glucosidase